MVSTALQSLDLVQASRTRWNPNLPSTGEIEIGLSAKATAMYVVLTTLANGRFSDNAFLLEAGNVSVTFIPWGDAAGPPGSPALQKTIALLKRSLRVEHLAENLA